LLPDAAGSTPAGRYDKIGGLACGQLNNFRLASLVVAGIFICFSLQKIITLYESLSSGLAG